MIFNAFIASIILWLRNRLVSDWRNVMKWKSAQASAVGTLFAAAAFSISLSSAGMQFLGAFGIRGALGVCLLIFVCAFIGRMWYQPRLHDPDDKGDSE